MNLQSFTFPWGIPGEDCTGPRGPTQARLGVLRRTSIIAAEISSAGQTVATSFSVLLTGGNMPGFGWEVTSNGTLTSDAA